jgi:hypothetical protein
MCPECGSKMYKIDDDTRLCKNQNCQAIYGEEEIEEADDLF